MNFYWRLKQSQKWGKKSKPWFFFARLLAFSIFVSQYHFSLMAKIWDLIVGQVINGVLLINRKIGIGLLKWSL